MESGCLELINVEVNALLNEPLDVFWKENIVNPSLCSLGEVSGTLSKEASSYGRQTVFQSLHKHSKQTFEPSLDTFLPALSKSSYSAKLQRQRSGPGTPCKTSVYFQSLKKPVSSSARKHRRQWTTKISIRIFSFRH